MNITENLIEVFKNLMEESYEVLNTRHLGYMNIEFIEAGKFNAWRDKILTVIGASKLEIPDVVQTIKDLNPEYPSSVKALNNSLTSIIELLEIMPLATRKKINLIIL